MLISPIVISLYIKIYMEVFEHGDAQSSLLIGFSSCKSSSEIGIQWVTIVGLTYKVFQPPNDQRSRKQVRQDTAGNVVAPNGAAVLNCRSSAWYSTVCGNCVQGLRLCQTEILLPWVGIFVCFTPPSLCSQVIFAVRPSSCSSFCAAGKGLGQILDPRLGFGFGEGLGRPPGGDQGFSRWSGGITGVLDLKQTYEEMGLGFRVHITHCVRSSPLG